MKISRMGKYSDLIEANGVSYVLRQWEFCYRVHVKGDPQTSATFANRRQAVAFIKSLQD